VAIAFAFCVKAKKNETSSEPAPLFFSRIVTCFNFLPKIHADGITFFLDTSSLFASGYRSQYLSSEDGNASFCFLTVTMFLGSNIPQGRQRFLHVDAFENKSYLCIFS
jgi:hypothetical protein